MDLFILECIKSIEFAESETSKFILEFYTDLTFEDNTSIDENNTKTKLPVNPANC